jgi:hypothetical protein
MVANLPPNAIRPFWRSGAWNRGAWKYPSRESLPGPPRAGKPALVPRALGACASGARRLRLGRSALGACASGARRLRLGQFHPSRRPHNMGGA